MSAERCRSQAEMGRWGVSYRSMEIIFSDTPGSGRFFAMEQHPPRPPTPLDPLDLLARVGQIGFRSADLGGEGGERARGGEGGSF